MNPKPILFFTALFPQFLNASESLLPQFLILTGIFMGMSLVSLLPMARWPIARGGCASRIVTAQPAGGLDLRELRRGAAALETRGGLMRADGRRLGPRPDRQPRRNGSPH